MRTIFGFVGRFAIIRLYVSVRPSPLRASKFCHRVSRRFLYIASADAAKHLKAWFAPSVSLPVTLSALARQADAPGQVEPAGRLNVTISLASLALPLAKDNVFMRVK